MRTFQNVLEDAKEHKKVRLLAFGSSNTKRRNSGMHWVDCLDLALIQTYGAHPRTINAGIGGESSDDLLLRFEDDAAIFKPDAVFITVGGNDCQCEGLTRERFGDNLRELYRRFIAIDCAVVFQTYYAPNADDPGIQPLTPFYQYMETVRDAARDTGAVLVDHLARWEPFRKRYPEFYRPLMADSFHLNRLGNMVMGLDLARVFDLRLGEELSDDWLYPRACQALMDQVERGGASDP